MKQILRSDWLPKMGPFCPLGISRVGSARKSSPFRHLINPLLTKLVRSRWLYISLVLFCVFMDRNEKELGQLVLKLDQ